MSIKEYLFNLLKHAVGLLIGIPLLLVLAWTVNMDLAFVQVLTVAITVFVLSAVLMPLIQPYYNERKKSKNLTGKQKVVRYSIFFGVILIMFYGINLLAITT
ncbi:hypothetical protein [Geomicrobium sediminis]|uniref:Membrane channel-forming protein YqfA (Hemolysin III family) n=1 Tax=Geomicrobium sediminis TaxID=1347788 RepID=A0ABS2P6S7_9BACL|nr:hypothetical protein [Geomicrobium sediminis]MBM7631061.1 putative membrane channel-forming protein YqfA (hemolysin III family) [Geomicrobium sediminis]